MNQRPKLLILTMATRSMSKSSKPTANQQSHYDTLEINSRATQGEIKTAYFKLSKQYHPDKNSSEEAIAKFRDVAEAYEILGSYESRKHYDRSILTKSHFTTNKGSSSSSTPDDPKMKYYQTQAAVFRHQQKTGCTPIYDFDAWTKAHYGDMLDRSFIDKKKNAIRKEERAEITQESQHHDGIFFGLSLVFLAMLFLLSLSDNSLNDTHTEFPKIERKSKNDALNSTETGIQILSSKSD